ncbi:MAG: YraN family protein [Pseudomonadales bacterium]|jgi:putative endonuclease|nr:YraN family protein [Pseudomonadales bacterium]MCP5321522.1 YraN family protein [Pseudomonadales bacterium]MCP5336435.1 YraN family protein [Pseudomonadales bacterium]
MEHRSRHATDSATIGRAAEDHALQQLSTQGLRLVARNFRCRLGEIDLVMRDGDTLVFVEVRARASASARFGSAVETISATKRRRLQASAALFIAWHPSLQRQPLRFDLFAIDGAPGVATPRTTWIRGIFD